VPRAGPARSRHRWEHVPGALFENPTHAAGGPAPALCREPDLLLSAQALPRAVDLALGKEVGRGPVGSVVVSTLITHMAGRLSVLCREPGQRLSARTRGPPPTGATHGHACAESDRVALGRAASCAESRA
jgi:hypothetical protein